jgi:selenide,water dikinase
VKSKQALIIDKDKIVTNANAQKGDALVLTKPLGTGIVAFASQIGRADNPESVKASALSMTTLNKTASQLMVKFGAHACTDVTGFSLCGHLSEMALSSGVDVEVIWDNIPLFPGVLEYAAAGILPGAIERNKESCSKRIVPVESLPQEMVDICYDAQTSGGLLIAIDQKDAEAFLKALHDEGVSAAVIIGKISEKGSGLVHITTDDSRKIPSPQPGKPAEKLAPTEPQPQSAPAQPETEEVPCCADAVSSAGQVKDGGSDIAKIKAKFIDFLGSASAPHGLDAYTKQAMSIALSVAMRCEPCLKMHLKKAKEKGFTQDEIDEAAWMGISFGGSPTMVFYEQLKNS